MSGRHVAGIGRISEEHASFAGLERQEGDVRAEPGSVRNGDNREQDRLRSRQHVGKYMTALTLGKVNRGQHLLDAARCGNAAQSTVRLVGEHDRIVGPPAGSERQPSLADLSQGRRQRRVSPERAARPVPDPAPIRRKEWSRGLLRAWNGRSLLPVQRPHPQLLSIAAQTGEHESRAVR